MQQINWFVVANCFLYTGAGFYSMWAGRMTWAAVWWSYALGAMLLATLEK